MPEIIAHGRQSASPTIFACSLCHQTNGKGRPENAGVAGLPYEYIVQQLTEFRNGERTTSDPRKPAPPVTTNRDARNDTLAISSVATDTTRPSAGRRAASFGHHGSQDSPDPGVGPP